MDKIQKAIREGQRSYYETGGRLDMVDHGYKTKCMKDAFMRGWHNQKYVDKNLFIFLRRIDNES